LCDRLVRKGLVQRGYRESSRREVEVALTPDGKKLVDRVRGKRRREIAKVVGAVPSATWVSIVDALNAFAAAAAPGDAASQAWSSGWEL
jgi:DNA-binding MarR family transcriptional regulator